ncbi:MAG: Cys-rich peptide radical SAM maturase CcpM [Lachnospiraceae bacterium]|nr:Cys-rich peptide radical SAM maturase CcpM [Lachnospiraceae bacterium]
MNNKPNIHLFRTRGASYFYDANTAAIVKISDSLYDALLNEKEPTLKEDIEYKEKLISKGYLSSFRPKEIVHPSTDIVEDILENNVEMITLQLTQQCNFRCAYCPYTIASEDRGHSAKRMTFEMAKKGVDFLLTHSANVKDPVIGFYGGEPFLEFDLIKKVIEYTKKKAGGKFFGFTVTTNGSLLTEDKVQFLEENSVIVMISLDGPKEVHDKNRKLAVSGKGSFEKVMDNVMRLYDAHPSFVKNNIQFNAVVDPVNQFSCFNEFFIKAEYIKNSSMLRTQILESKYTDYSDPTAVEFFMEREQEIFKMFLAKMGRLSEEKISPLVKMQYEEMINKLHLGRRTMLSLPEYGHPSGPCVPGSARVFLSCDGTLLPCEKVSEKTDAFKIGTIDEGFDFDLVRKILNIGKLTEEACKNCWAFTMCVSCANGCDDGSELSAQKRLADCQDVKGYLDEAFVHYCTLKELGCNYAAYGFNDPVEL